ncbi:flagellar hook protein FlgE [Oxalobacteraceae bacterium CAVE-383]|nr:flagellar hook protein FlgE [Oxalobacteraceae bacterium CAVE-383]
MGFQQGLSGLNAASKNLDVTGNNIANASTVGFKEAQAQFADMYANSMNRSGNTPVGIGVSTANVAQQFVQGNITPTNNPLDIAINGDGFFRMVSGTNNQTPMYGRNGQFQLDKNGFIINPSENGAFLTGLAAGVTGGDPVPIQINTASIPAVQTTAATDVLNLDSRDAVIATPFDFTDSTTYSDTTGMTVFDSLGNSHNIQTYYRKSAIAVGPPPTTSWQVYATVDGQPSPPFVAPATQAPIGTMTFDANGISTVVAPATDTFSIAIPAGAGTNAFTVPVDYTGTIQSGATFAELSRTQNGKSPGTLTGFEIGQDGAITGSYSNGLTRNLGTVVIANFANPNGLTPIGNNLYAPSAAAGEALIGKPTSGGLGSLQARATEDSNVDLTAELVNLIVAQRVYQANAQTIKAQDTILQTVVNGL